MGSWDEHIFEDDLALDIKAHFDAEVADGISPSEAALELMHSELAEEILGECDEDERDAAFWEESGGLFFAIAALQLEHDVLEDEVRALALTAIRHWLEMDEESERADALRELEAELHE